MFPSQPVSPRSFVFRETPSIYIYYICPKEKEKEKTNKKFARSLWKDKRQATPFRYGNNEKAMARLPVRVKQIRPPLKGVFANMLGFFCMSGAGAESRYGTQIVYVWVKGWFSAAPLLRGSMWLFPMRVSKS